MKQFVIYRAKNRIPYFVFRVDGECCIELYSQSVIIPIKQLYLADNKKLLYQDEEFICRCAYETDDFINFIDSIESYLNYDFFESHLDLFLDIWSRWYYVI